MILLIPEIIITDIREGIALRSGKGALNPVVRG